MAGDMPQRAGMSYCTSAGRTRRCVAKLIPPSICAFDYHARLTHGTLQHVADAGSRHNELRLARNGFDLLPQVANMGLDQIGIARFAKTPDMGNDLIESTDVIGVGRQKVEQDDFRWGSGVCSCYSP